MQKACSHACSLNWSPHYLEWKKDRLHRLLLTMRKWNPSAAEWSATVVNKNIVFRSYNSDPCLLTLRTGFLQSYGACLFPANSYFIASKYYVLMKVIPILINMMFPAKLTDVQKTADSWLPVIWCTCLSVRRAKISTWNWKLSKLASDQGTFTCQVFTEKQFKKYYCCLIFKVLSCIYHVNVTTAPRCSRAGIIISMSWMGSRHSRSIKDQELTENSDSRTELL